MTLKKILILSLVLISISVSFCLNDLNLIAKNDNVEKLPLFNLEIPSVESSFNKISSLNQVSIFSETDNQEMKVIISLKDPSEIWKSEVSAMNEKDKTNLKTIMRDYVANKISLNKINNYFSSFNGFSAEITYETYLYLLSNPLIKSISKNEKVYMNLDESVEIIGANNIWNYSINSQYLTGKGQTVCVVDTGIDYTHEALGSCSLTQSDNYESYTLDSLPLDPYPNNYNVTWIINKTGYENIAVYFDYIDIELGYDFIYLYDSQGNLYQSISGSYSGWSFIIPGDTIILQFITDFSINGSSGYSGFSVDYVSNFTYTNWDNCNKVIGGYDFVNDDFDPFDDESHGTHVAGIVAGNSSRIKGVAPDANLFAVKVLDNNGSGYDDNILAGIEYCISNAEEYNISAISLSLGRGLYSDYCDEVLPEMTAAVNLAVLKNISVVVAVGNDYYINPYDLVAFPACIRNVTRVGSSTKDDNSISIFSKRWALDILVAPGSDIYSSVPGSYESWDGTSMATPHVSGAIALINQYYKENNEYVSPQEIYSKLNQTGKQILQSGRNYSRIDLSNFFTYNSIFFKNISISSNGNLGIYANKTTLVTLNFTSVLPRYIYNVTIGNYSAEVVNLGDNTSWSASRILNDSDSQGRISFKINDKSYETTDTSYVIFDLIAPKLVSFSYPQLINAGENFTIQLNWSYGYTPIYSFGLPNYEHLLSNNIINSKNYENITFFYNSSIFQQGELNLDFWVKDYNYNMSNIILSIPINNTYLPKIDIISPINGSIYSNKTQLLNISVIHNDLDSVWYNYNGTNITYIEPINITFDEGLNLLYVWANTSLGTINLSSVNFIIDTEAPNIWGYFSTLFENNSYSFYNTISDNSNSSCVFKLNNTILQTFNTLNYFSQNNLIFYADEGYYNLNIECTDLMGNVGYYNENFIYNHHPELNNLDYNSIIDQNQNITLNLTFNNGLYGNVSISNFFVVENYNNNFSYYINYTNFVNFTNFNYSSFFNVLEISNLFLNSSNNFYYYTNLSNHLNYSYSNEQGNNTLLFENNTLTFIYIRENSNQNSTNIYNVSNLFYNNNFIVDYIQNNSLNYVYINYPVLEEQVGRNLTFILPFYDNFNGNYLNYNLNSSTIYSNNYHEDNSDECYNSSCLRYDYTYDNSFNFQNYFVNPLITIYVKDIIAPNLTINEVPDYSTQYNQSIRFNVSDNVDFKQVNCSLYLNNRYNQSKLIYPNGSQQYFNINLSDGQYNYSVKCVDYDLNQANQTYTMTIDTIKPVINILSLSNNSYYNNATKLLNISRVDLTPGSVWYNFEGENITYTSAVNVIFNEGINTLIVYSNDSASNLNKTSISFIIDTVAPKLTFNSLANNSWTNKLFTNVSYNFVDELSINASCQLRINNITVVSNSILSNNTLINYNNKNNASVNNYNYSCVDLAGNYNESLLTLKFDSAVPLTNVMNYTNNWTNQDLNILLLANDSLSGVNKIQFRNSSINSWTDYDFNLNITQDFVGAIEYRAIDNAGNTESSKFLMARVDKTAPVISQILSPSIVLNNSQMQIEVIASDALSGLLNASVNINGTTYAMNYSLGKYYASFTSPNLEGVYELNVTVFDKAFNLNNESVNLIVNGGLPMTKVSIANGSTVLNNTQLTLTFSNHINSLIIVNGNSTNITQSSYSLIISGDESFTFDVINYNSLNQTISNYTYNIDSIKPLVNIIGLSNNSKVNSTVLINVSAIDANLFNVSLLIDNILYNSKTISPYNFYYPTTLLNDGLHNFSVIVYDLVGNKNTSSIILNFTNKITVNLNVSGDVNLSSGEITRDDLSETNLGSVIYEINGLNSSVANITLASGNYSYGLLATIGAININASTNAESEVYCLIPKSVLLGFNLSAPYSTLSVYT
ncbi:MAG: S8 family serine peptidase, partial [Candidatus Nanoarchaeia archaeon]|nr:S8 family serine peptidase [Candidatus Nanoarchaeia archaeon]